MPKSIETSSASKLNILCNQQVKTARTILNSEPKSIIRDDEEGKCQRVDIEVLGRRILMKKETEKTLIYKYFTIEV
jgi:hypothetical protein